MNTDRTKIIHRRTPESAAMVANVRRAMAITARINRLAFEDADEIRALFSELIGKEVDSGFSLIPPFYTAGGDEIPLGKNVFINGATGSRDPAAPVAPAEALRQLPICSCRVGSVNSYSNLHETGSFAS